MRCRQAIEFICIQQKKRYFCVKFGETTRYRVFVAEIRVIKVKGNVLITKNSNTLCIL